VGDNGWLESLFFKSGLHKWCNLPLSLLDGAVTDTMKQCRQFDRQFFGGREQSSVMAIPN